MFLETTIGGAVLGAFLQVLFDRLASRPVLRFFKRLVVDDTALKVPLMAINAVLQDAEDKQFTHHLVKQWIDELKDVVYDSEDLFNDITLLDATKTSPLPQQVETKMLSIVKRMEYMAKHKDLILKEGTVVSGRTFSRLPSTSLVNESAICGRTDDVSTVMSWLVPRIAANQNGDEPNLSSTNGDENHINEINLVPVQLIALVGMPGIGKTTLAQLLFNKEEVKKHFKLRTWACVSDDFDVFKVTKTILESATVQHSNATNFDVLQNQLRMKLEKERFLLVLDDVWNENYMDWDVLRSPFRVGVPGSTIIVTTRNQNVATIVHAHKIHTLHWLSETDSLSLFEKYANPSNHELSPRMRVIGEDIVEKCKGLPLAIKTLGSMLHSKLEVEDWESILNSKFWDFPNDKSNLLLVLRMSYHYLPPNLKRCFAYCSIFPKGYQIEEKKLVLLWMAEGLVPKPKGNKRIEDVGHDCFHELTSRSFFQPSTKDRKCFVMHDLVSDLARFVAGDFCFSADEDARSPKISEKTRHLSYIPRVQEQRSIFDAFYKIKHLRTFLPLTCEKSALGSISFCSSSVYEKLFTVYPYLHVLSLSNYDISGLSTKIEDMRHLHFLDVSGTPIGELPETICSLYNLQTLLLSDCIKLVLLPEKMGKLTNLRHLDITNTKKLCQMPLSIRKLPSLQVLTDFVVSNSSDGSKADGLGDLSDLHGKLTISKLENVVDTTDAQSAKLKEKRYLDELVFKWTSCSPNAAMEILKELRPHENLRKLTIENYGGNTFTSWLGDSAYSNMVFLSLSKCKHCLSLPPLGQLPSLKELNLEHLEILSNVGDEFYGTGSPFKSLEILRFKNMPNWKTWSSSGEFPSLQKLKMIDCSELTGNLPNRVFTGLTKLHVENCCHLESLQNPDPRGHVFLKKLKIKNCQSLAHCLETGLSAPELTSLSVSGYDGLLTCCSLPLLESLFIENVDSMDGWELQQLTSLVELEICGSDTLRSLPVEGMPTSLTHLSIYECPLLGVSCKRDGSEWSRIHFISKIEIDGIDIN